MEWKQEGDILPPASAGEPDSVRAWEPWALEGEDGGLHLWYSGHDRTTGRILEAVRKPDEPWRRLGVAIEPGLAGDSDRYGVGSPCVVRVAEGFLMAYSGFDGQISRLHLATSADGHRWTTRGTVVDQEEGDILAGGSPCLVVRGEEWWLYYSGSDDRDGAERPDAGRRASILGAVSRSGDSWDRIGPVLEPEPGELAVTHPCVLEISRRLYLFFASEQEEAGSIALATSPDGVEWTRRGIVLAPDDDLDASSVGTPCIVRLRDGSLRMWYSRRPWGDDQLAYAVCAATFPGPLPAGA
ncbi:MAG: hypothetical protein ACRDZ7_06090 [Acidimicrobiia bacterium]